MSESVVELMETVVVTAVVVALGVLDDGCVISERWWNAK
jgi:hypothetical protein